MPLFAEAASSAPAARRFIVHVTPEMIRHSRLLDVLYFVDFLYVAGVLILVMQAGMSARVRDVARRGVRWEFLAAMFYCILMGLIVTAFEFPLSFYQGFVVPHQFDLTNQSFASWLADFGKGLAVDLIIVSFLAAFALVGIRRVRRWWIALWLVSIPLTILGVVITPLIID